MPYRKRDFQEMLLDMLTLIKRKHPKSVSESDLNYKGNISGTSLPRIRSYAEDNDLITISTRMRGTKEVRKYSITKKGLGLTEAWSRYKRDLRALGLEDMIVSEV